MIKAKHILWMLFLLSFSANANQNESVDADFLEFLAEMEEVTGNGFNTWLESDETETNPIATTIDDTTSY